MQRFVILCAALLLPAAPALAQTPVGCVALYPPAAAKAGIEGTATLSVHITSAGVVENAQVIESSGNADLDTASIACAAQTHINPAEQNGAPIDIDWKIAVGWQRSGYSGVHPLGSIACRDIHQSAAEVAAVRRATKVMFTIAEDGSVRDPKIEQSSGSPAMDQQAAECVLQRHYPPATSNGQPVAIEWHANYAWVVH